MIYASLALTRLVEQFYLAGAKWTEDREPVATNNIGEASFRTDLRSTKQHHSTMRLILFATFCLLHFVGSAQRIENSSRSTTGYINADGRIENSSRSTVGYINKDGRIENSSRSTIGYINADGRIENSSRSTVGYVNKDGRVENSSRSTIGYVNKDGRVENSSRSTIGYANDVPATWAAVFFFFFTFEK